MLVAFLVGEACSSSSPSGTAPVSSGGATVAPTGGVSGTSVVMPGVAGPATGGAAVEPDPRCGVIDCVPDDPSACDASEASDLPDAGGGGAAGQGGELGAVSGGMGEGGAGGQGGVGPSDGGQGASPGHPLGCSVVRKDGEPLAQCVASGAGEADAPCFDGADCRAGLACIGDETTGRCRPFCCFGDGACDAFPGTYCAARSMREDGGEEPPADPLLVPVCVVAQDCDLAQTYPCESAQRCDCPVPTACQVVRPDGTTACVDPGMGQSGEPCPCAWDHVCSRGTGQCLKLCSTLTATRPCTAGKCQASAELPDGWGVCIGL